LKQINLLCKRLLLACVASMFAASLCGAQTPGGNNSQPAASGKAPAHGKEPAAAKTSALDEELSRTPAGKTVAKFFAAFNSGDLKTMRAFHESFGGDPENADRDMEVYEKTGGFKLHSLTSADKDEIVVLVQTKKDARWLSFQFTLDSQEPHGITGLDLRPGHPPAN
jgi:hypothetical protein